MTGTVARGGERGAVLSVPGSIRSGMEDDRKDWMNMEDGYYHLYLEELKTIPPCTNEERRSLLDRLTIGELAARDRLIEGHLILALAVA